MCIIEIVTKQINIIKINDCVYGVSMFIFYNYLYTNYIPNTYYYICHKENLLCRQNV